MRGTFCKNIFCTLASILSIIFCRLTVTKKVPDWYFLAWMVRTPHVSNLAQRAHPSENKLFHRRFTITTQQQSFSLQCSLILLTHTIAGAHASTHVTSLMHVKNNMHHVPLFMTLIVWENGMKEMNKKHEIEDFIIFLTVVNRLLT